ncbi:MAG: DUF59 domain-containing protein [Deltaproteobacteria bacterium]|nr:DUF59 domain-containing protein [Deltaproteobacteria bacterium]
MTTTAQKELKSHLQKVLGSLRDPSTGMRLEDLPLLDGLEIDEKGINLSLSPSSNVCPLIFKLGSDIKQAVQEAAPGVPIHFLINNHKRKQEIEEFLSDT